MPRYGHENLVCRHGHRHRLIVCVSGHEGLPACPEYVFNGQCGEPLLIAEDTEFNGTEHVQVWKPVKTAEGVFETREDWHRYRKKVAENLKVPEESVVLNTVTKGQARVKADEAAHRGWLGRRSRGGEEAYREHVRDQRRKSGKDERIIVGYRGSR